MYNRFKELGIPVTLTRTTDETLEPTQRVERILAAYGDNPNVIVISNHINAGGADGAEVIYALRNTSTLANLILDNIEIEGQNVRKAYQRRLPSDTSKDYYFIHRDTGTTQPVIIEYGFLDSTGDDVNQLKNDYESLAEAVVRAIAEYINVPYIPQNGNYHTVVKGESLYSIAKKYGVTVDELKNANNLLNNSLSIGQILKIPDKQTNEENNNIYIVKSGDSLYSIAKKFNTSVDILKELNNLNTTSLSIGQVLKLPYTPVNSSEYIVKSGDSLYSIAKKYGVTVDELKSTNNLTNNLLSIGQTLKIPTANETPNDNTNYETYTVIKGDNLYAIAKKFNTTQNELMQLNNLSTNLLSIGQVLKLPTVTNANNTYTVVQGDSLYSIAKRFNTTVDNIKRINNLTSNTLQIGQILKI